jgi:hypothetical protein
MTGAAGGLRRAGKPGKERRRRGQPEQRARELSPTPRSASMLELVEHRHVHLPSAVLLAPAAPA